MGAEHSGNDHRIFDTLEIEELKGKPYSVGKGPRLRDGGTLKPVNKMFIRSDGAVQREFDGGTVVYNPMGNSAVTINFETLYLSAANGSTAINFALQPMDGDLYLKVV